MDQREITVDILTEIINQGKYNNLALKDSLKKHNALEITQKAFITECVNGTLRNLLHIDFIINNYSSIKVKKMKPFIANLLRSAVYQIKFLDKTPDFAVCNESVTICKKRGFKNLSGFVNAILRNIIRNTPEIKYPKENSLEYLSVYYSIDKWILEYWMEELDINDIREILEYQNTTPVVSIAINTNKISKENLISILEKENIEVIKNPIIDNALYIKKISDITKKESYINGYYHIIDTSSMLSAIVVNPSEEDLVYDICAAPGGKSFFMSYLMHNKGKIYSYDIYSKKMKLMEDSIERLGIKNINLFLQDARIVDEKRKNTADCILLDLPCSGLGILQKKPDIKYNKTIEDVDSLVILQRDIIKNSLGYLKPNGKLVFSTCTISKKENIENINWILENFDFELEDISKIIPKEIVSDTSKKGYIQILPKKSNYHMDGFFIACFRKRS